MKPQSPVRLVAALALLGAALACRTVAPEPATPPVVAPPPQPQAPDGPCAGAHAEHPGAPAWFHDDYPAALACARQRDLPVVIDLWAPWCHTCLSMQHTVLIDPGVADLADRFVWLAVDTDRADNAAMLEQFAPSVWPTFLVISTDESVQARYLGAASVAQFRAFLRQGEQGHLDARSAAGRLAADAPEALLRQGDRAALAGDMVAADSAYSQALAAAPADWDRRPDVLVSLMGVRHRRGALSECVALGLEAMDQTGQSASAADFCYYAELCAAASGDQPRAHQLRQAALRRLRALVDDPAATLSVDDRSDALRILREIHEGQGDQAAARACAQQQRTLLDTAAAAAPDALAASTYNWPRAEVYVYLGEGRQLVPALQRSVADLPDDYDPPYRLAWVLLQVGDTEPAAAAIDLAAARGYGPRLARIFGLAAEIHKARGDQVAERRARTQTVELLQSLPASQQRPAALAEAQAALQALDAVPAPE